MRFVTFNEDTIYTYHNDPSTFEDVKEGWRVICVGKFNKRGKLRATRNRRPRVQVVDCEGAV